MALLENWFNKKTNDKPADNASTCPAAPAAQRDAETASRRQKRMARRELLYTVVREAMVRAGVLSVHYSFKVLSLEPQGRQYIVMIDMATDCALPGQRQTAIEKQIAHEVKVRHDISVTAIYWRLTSQRKGIARHGRPDIKDAPGAPRFEAIGADEVAALRQALAAGVGTAAGFEDTEVIVGGPPYPALSQTQYGQLN